MKHKLLFVYEHQYEDTWQDGLFAALELIGQKHEVTKLNLVNGKLIDDMANFNEYDFILGWGAFNSPVDTALQLLRQLSTITAPMGLCLAGNTFPLNQQKYDVIFYETEWQKQWVIETRVCEEAPNLVHAFGYNSKIYTAYPWLDIGNNRFIDYLTVGAFANWKRQEKILQKDGLKMAIGEIQQGNLAESMRIIGPLLAKGVIISDMIEARKLAYFYRQSRYVYIPADINGGGERAVLEGQASGAKVIVEDDNPKLKELFGKKWNEEYYRDQLYMGIELVSELDWQ